jgi:hypothetical protein
VIGPSVLKEVSERRGVWAGLRKHSLADTGKLLLKLISQCLIRHKAVATEASSVCSFRLKSTCLTELVERPEKVPKNKDLKKSQ